MKLIEHELSHDIDLGKKYYLSIIFGEGQDGSSAFKDVEGSYHTGTIFNVVIGTGAIMENKFILIGSIVTDTNPHTNFTSVTYKINDQEVASYREEVDQANSSIYFSTKISFI